MEILLLLAVAIWVTWHFQKTGRTKTRKTQVAPVAKFHAEVDDALDQEGWSDEQEWVQSAPRPICGQLLLRYADARGTVTDRMVDAVECDTVNPAGMLIAFCHLRKSIRTFRIDRIVQATDMETGEVIGSLTAFAAKKYSASPKATIDTLLREASDPMRALFYIGKADGRFTAKEKQIFLVFCRAATGDLRLQMGDVERMCSDMAIPTKQSFKLICGRLAKLDEGQRGTILNVAEAIVSTEKTISGDEVDALAYMRKKLAVHAIA